MKSERYASATKPAWYHWLLLGLVLALAVFVLGIWSPAVLGPTGTSQPLYTGRMNLAHISVKSPFPDTMTNPDGFCMQTDSPEYATGIKTLNIVLFNETDEDAFFGMPYALEAYRDGSWHSVPFGKPMEGSVRAWLAYAIPLPARNSRSDTIKLTEHEPLAPGRYRLVKDVFLNDGEPKTSLDERTRTVWCPFAITAAAPSGPATAR